MKKNIFITLLIILSACQEDNTNAHINNSTPPQNTSNAPINNSTPPQNTSNAPINNSTPPQNTSNATKNSYTISSNIMHGENTYLFYSLCLGDDIGKIGSLIPSTTVNLDKSTNSGEITCNSHSVKFQYDTKNSDGGVILKLKDFVFEDERQKIHQTGFKNTAKALGHALWFLNSNNNTLEVILSHDDDIYNKIDIDFIKATVTNKADKKSSSINDTYFNNSTDYIKFNPTK